jgi:hypothetical protein
MSIGTGGAVSTGGAGGTTVSTCGLSGLLSYFPFDDDTSDHVSGRVSTAINTPFGPGLRGQALQFSGAGSGLLVGTSGLLSGARTLCAWVRPERTTGLGQPVFVGGTVNIGDFFSLQSSTPQGDCASAAFEGEPFIDHWGTACYTGGPLAPDGAWSSVCYGYDGGDVLTFSVNSQSFQIPGMLYDFEFSSITIGSSLIGGTTTQAFFNGAIDEVTIWDHSLAPDEIAALWNLGQGCRAL